MLSMEKLSDFLPAGSNFAKWALLFLPGGKPGSQVADFQCPDYALVAPGAACAM
jgi:hypothetical protein